MDTDHILLEISRKKEQIQKKKAEIRKLESDIFELKLKLSDSMIIDIDYDDYFVIPKRIFESYMESIL